MTLWFGPTWNAPVCDPNRHTDTPTGDVCQECETHIKDGDQGIIVPTGPTVRFAYHKVCFLRTVIPCEQWDGELLENLPDHWAQHRKEHHGS